MASSNSTRGRHALIGAVAFLLFCAALLKKIGDPDVWYHMVVAREFVRSWHVPAAEFYVYTMLGSPTAFHEYGFGLLVYAAFTWFGAWGVSLLNACVGAASLVILFRAAATGRARPFVSLMLLAPLLWLVDYRMTYRAEAYLYLALAVELWLLERYRSGADPRWLLPIPALVAVLSNIHPSAMILLMILGAYAIQALVDHAPTGGARRAAAWFAAIMLAGTLAGAVNPYGFSQLFLPLHFAGQRELLKATAEFTPTLNTSRAPAFFALCAAGTLALVLRKQRRLVDELLLLLFAFVGAMHVRNVALLALIVYGPVARMLENLAERLADSKDRPMLRFAYPSVLIALALIAAVAARSPVWGAGLIRQVFPVDAATLIARHKPRGRVFNYPHLGGYLAWRLYPDYLVAVDGRRYYGWDNALKVADAFFRGGDSFAQIVREYDVTMIVTPGTAQTVGSLVPVVLALDGDDGWSLVSAEWAALLFMRTEVARSAGIPVLGKDLIWRHVVDDATAVLATSPSPSPTVYRSLGIALFKLRDYTGSEDWLTRYVTAKPEDASALQLVELLRGARQGNPDARRALDEIEARRQATAQP